MSLNQPAQPTTSKDAATDWWRAPLYFLVHVVVGTAIFMSVAGAAFCLALFIDLFKSQGMEGIIVWGLVAGKYVSFVCDLLLFIKFLWCTSKRTWGELR